MEDKENSHSILFSNSHHRIANSVHTPRHLGSKNFITSNNSNLTPLKSTIANNVTPSLRRSALRPKDLNGSTKVNPVMSGKPVGVMSVEKKKVSAVGKSIAAGKSVKKVHWTPLLDKSNHQNNANVSPIRSLLAKTPLRSVSEMTPTGIKPAAFSVSSLTRERKPLSSSNLHSAFSATTPKTTTALSIRKALDSPLPNPASNHINSFRRSKLASHLNEEIVWGDSAIEEHNQHELEDIEEMHNEWNEDEYLPEFIPPVKVIEKFDETIRNSSFPLFLESPEERPASPPSPSFLLGANDSNADFDDLIEESFLNHHHNNKEGGEEQEPGHSNELVQKMDFFFNENEIEIGSGEDDELILF